MLAYSPYTGFTPTSTPDAIPSGTLAIAPGTPATASRRSAPGSGRSDLPHAGTGLKRRLRELRRRLSYREWPS